MTQDSEHWEQLQELFHLAEMTREEDRERVLTQKCPDPRIRRRVMSIFRGAHIESEEEPRRVSPFLSGKIGPYMLIRHLGSGGIGTVYLVERMVGGGLQRSALKVLAPHAAGPAFVERFHREQHILASLDHPNITRMLDGGLSEEGQPYLVMEYVDGVPLDVYCDERNLGIEERLKLFLRVCDAVAYAHRNLVVHLDLKPTNIFVSAEGTVKLLDFGTSKLIETDSMLTTTVMATPAYASPEQLRNEPVTTACDVYALGAILFELLSGRRPGDRASVAVMIERAMKEDEPEDLPKAVTSEAALHRGVSESRLRQLLSGDLATIVEKCLSPRPKNRYPSIDSLTVDIERYMSGRPILARPQTTLYRINKFVRRNRGSVAATGLITLALIGSLGYGAWRQQEALRQGQRALRMQTFIYRLFKLANSNYTGKPAATVPEFLALGVKVLPEYIKDPADLRSAQMGLAESMYENGDLNNAQKVFNKTIAEAKSAGDVGSEAEAEAFSGNIAYLQGQTDQGQTLTAHALELSRRPSVTPTVRVWSEIYYAANRENNGFRSDENLRLMESAVKESRDRHLPERETAYAIYMLASDFEVRGQLDEAERLINEAIAIYGREPYAICDQSEMYADLAYIRAARGQFEASLPLYQQAYDGYKRCSGPDNRGTLVVEDYMAGAMIRSGKAKEAIPMLEASMPAWRKVAGSSPDLANPLHFLAMAYVDTGQYVRGEKTAEELVKVQEGKVAADDHRMGSSHLLWARALAGEHRYREALPHAEIADRVLAQTLISPTQKQVSADAHRVLLEIQSNLAKK
jgi:eukaryotic-like serine/threonine-protein kinase